MTLEMALGMLFYVVSLATQRRRSASHERDVVMQSPSPHPDPSATITELSRIAVISAAC